MTLTDSYNIQMTDALTQKTFAAKALIKVRSGRVAIGDYVASPASLSKDSYYLTPNDDPIVVEGTIGLLMLSSVADVRILEFTEN